MLRILSAAAPGHIAHTHSKRLASGNLMREFLAKLRYARRNKKFTVQCPSDYRLAR